MGTIEVPIDKAMRWVGVTDPQACGEVFASAGIPSALSVSGGKITKIKLEHVWVEAWIDYVPSRGAVHKKGDTWIPLDPSFKDYTYIMDIDLGSIVVFDAENFIEEIKASASVNETEGYVTNVNRNLIQTRLQEYQDQIQTFLDQAYPDATIDDVFGKREIKAEETEIILGSFPYTVLARLDEYSQVPENLQSKLTIELSSEDYLFPAVIITKSLPELAGKRITISYTPATPEDKAVIDTYREVACLS